MKCSKYIHKLLYFWSTNEAACLFNVYSTKDGVWQHACHL